MKIKSSRLETIAATLNQYPVDDLPEIAFAGRSNVGKSSFINAVINRKNLARTSSKPGKTRTVNFYNINEEFRLVDLPGYGYAAVSKTEKENWAKIIETYLNNRKNLYETILIVDIRHKPTENDKQMYDWILSYDFTGFVIANKADKISKSKFKTNIDIIMKALNIKDRDLIIPFSSEKKINIDIIREQIENIIKYGSGFEE
ncbi:ribosome biogenesis GTP-binding protein YihA/YsxC [Miniphocaeibacter halophilus]|uniref:YihA family ribosome biogenesis GTP-binding protein n=1 Tax=Miniphocaeibacter halophilus TaxID=2931922 RepID=A0AC61MQD7_9FIRM|nr:ribosome biogenesis GTP-binding protein YihA/YsxC [Miniphocaeibacter halophilus]QQK07169.1 YihA family ribosome biogenesis GTP-binding protein [Miniphocaeibacter halophilus]